MLIEIRRGLDVPVDGKPEQVIHAADEPERVAIVGMDHPYARPSLLVEEGDRVASGEALYHERSDPDVRYTSPASGYVREINRGPQRSVVSIAIEREGDRFRRFPTFEDGFDGDAVAAVLLASGLWTAFRTRPSAGVPASAARPDELYVTAIDTNPLSADPRVVIDDARDDFRLGLTALSRLAHGKVFVCTAPGNDLTVPDLANVELAQFAGRHPSGLIGTHIHHLGSADCAPGRRWHVGYQDVIAIGSLLSNGTLPSERIVALGGDGARAPRLLRTRLGADLVSLLDGETLPSSRVIVGSILTGWRTTPATHYVSRFHNQVSLIRDRDSTDNASGMLAVEAFEKVWPFAVPPLPLLRALLIADTETASALGCAGLDVEDLALCSYVCPARLDYGQALLETQAAMKRFA